MTKGDIASLLLIVALFAALSMCSQDEKHDAENVASEFNE
jgi:hypothetical protein